MCHDGLLTQGCSNKWRQNEKTRGHNYFSTWNKSGHTRRQIKYKLWNVSCTYILHFCSVTKSCLTLGPHGLQHARLSCPSLSLGAYSNSCALSQWCYPTISSSIVPFSSSLQSCPVSGSLPESVLCIRWAKYWIFSFSISPSSEYLGLISFRIDWFDLLAVQGTHKRVFSSSRIQKYQFFGAQSSLWSNILHDYWKTMGLIIWAFFSKVMSLFFFFFF